MTCDLIKAERQGARSDVANIAVVQQGSVVRLDPDQLRAARASADLQAARTATRDASLTATRTAELLAVLSASCNDGLRKRRIAMNYFLR